MLTIRSTVLKDKIRKKTSKFHTLHRNDLNPKGYSLKIAEARNVTMKFMFMKFNIQYKMKISLCSQLSSFNIKCSLRRGPDNISGTFTFI